MKLAIVMGHNSASQGAVPKACFWHEKLLAAGTTRRMLLWGCSAHDGEIRVSYWLGQTDGSVRGIEGLERGQL